MSEYVTEEVCAETSQMWPEAEEGDGVCPGLSARQWKRLGKK